MGLVTGQLTTQDKDAAYAFEGRKRGALSARRIGGLFQP